MDPRHTGDILKHLEKQNELLNEAQKTMTQELLKLEVEEQMMMRKLYELITHHRLNKKKTEETRNVSEGKETDRDLGSRSGVPLRVYTRQRHREPIESSSSSTVTTVDEEH